MHVAWSAGCAHAAAPSSLKPTSASRMHVRSFATSRWPPSHFGLAYAVAHFVMRSVAYSLDELSTCRSCSVEHAAHAPQCSTVRPASSASARLIVRGVRSPSAAATHTSAVLKSSHQNDSFHGVCERHGCSSPSGSPARLHAQLSPSAPLRAPVIERS